MPAPSTHIAKSNARSHIFFMLIYCKLHVPLIQGKIQALIFFPRYLNMISDFPSLFVCQWFHLAFVWSFVPHLSFFWYLGRASRKHGYIILTPLIPLLYSKTGVYRGIHYFSYFAQKHRLWYSLEPPRRGGSNEYPQSMFGAEI